MLVEEKTTGGLFAMKVLKKEFVIENDELASVRAERAIFQIANRERSPFLLPMHECFQTPVCRAHPPPPRARAAGRQR